MDKGVYFKDNTYGPAGIAGVSHATTMYEYGSWAQWAQTQVHSKYSFKAQKHKLKVMN